MSVRHPIIAITGSSGAGTTSVTRTFQNIFRREGVDAAVIEGDSFHRHDRKEMKQRMAEAERAGDKNFSHFGAENNLFPELEALSCRSGQQCKREPRGRCGDAGGQSSLVCRCAGGCRGVSAPDALCDGSQLV